MAIFQNDPFPGTDYTRFLEWKKVTTPAGQTFYVVPGNEAYVYDPVASNATGRKVFRANPSLSIQKQQEEEERLKKAEKQQEYLSSPGGQLLPVAGTVGGLWAANQLMKPGVTAAQVLPNGSVLMSDGTIKAAGALPGISPGAQAAAQGAIANQASGGYGDVTADLSGYTDQLPEGTEVANDGSIIDSETGQVVGRVAQGALGAYQIYQGFNRFKDDKIGGSLNMASGGGNVASALGYKSVGPYAGPLMAASGFYDGIRAWENGGKGIRGAGAQLGAGIGTMIMPGVGTAAGAAIGNALGYGLDKLGMFHKTTRQVAQEHTEDLLKTSDDPTYQAYVQGMREQHNSAPPDPSKPFHGGQYGSWEEYKNAGLDRKDLTGVYGNIKAYGERWASLTQEQREAVTQANIDADNYDAKKGEVVMRDEKKGMELLDSTLKGFQAGQQDQAKKQAPAVSPQAQAAAQGATGLPATPPKYFGGPVVVPQPILKPRPYQRGLP